MSNWLPDGKPDWWSTASDFFSNPESTVRGWIAGWLVAGYLAFYTSVLDILQTPFEVGRDAIWTVFEAFGGVLRQMGTVYAGALELIGGSLELVTTAGGPFGFVIGFAMFAAFIIVLSWLFRALIRVIPVL